MVEITVADFKDQIRNAALEEAAKLAESGCDPDREDGEYRDIDGCYQEGYDAGRNDKGVSIAGFLSESSNGGTTTEVDGITLRDLFAMATLAGFCADPDIGLRSRDECARHAVAIYRMADAMLAAREPCPDCDESNGCGAHD